MRNTYQLNLVKQDIAAQEGYAVPDLIQFPENMSDQWELDCYSRPVQSADKKKLWEVLITDSTGSFKYLKVLPSNIVNSRTLRKVVEELIDASPVRPRVIRFFRNQMYNMISIALNPLDVEIKASRYAPNLLMWLQDRERNIYPLMDGYNPTLKQQTILDYEVKQAEKLPDTLRAQSYAFVALPAESFWNGEINQENMQRGKVVPLRDMPKTGWIHGITLFSSRATSIATWMTGVEIASLKADLLTKELILNADITRQFVVAPLTDKQKEEARVFEKGKASSNGYHFLSVQAGPDADGVEGFWLLREFDSDL